MHSSTLAKRYASALADLAQDNGLLKKIGTDLVEFQSVVKETPEFGVLLANPTISRDRQMKLVEICVAKSDIDPLTRHFLGLLVHKRRMLLLNDIVAAYGRIVEKQSGAVTVQVLAPKSLAKAQEERLVKVLSAKTGKDVRLDFNLGPELLGGMIVRIGSVMMDYSVRGQLNRLKAQLRG
ncbi:MAG: ATP synthase F1 subunit delta [Magnetococcales bacterium]|nr:ATP synthase F1 subunit delta [Magnetococcales bacterium]